MSSGQSRGFQQLFDKCCIQYAANQRPSPPGTATKTSSQETLAKCVLFALLPAEICVCHKHSQQLLQERAAPELASCIQMLP